MQLFSGEKGLWSVAEEALLPRSAFEGSVVVGWIPFAAPLLEPVTISVHLQDMDVMGSAVEQSAGEPFGAEDLGPFLEGQVAGHQRGCAFVALLPASRCDLPSGIPPIFQISVFGI